MAEILQFLLFVQLLVGLLCLEGFLLKVLDSPFQHFYLLLRMLFFFGFFELFPPWPEGPVEGPTVNCSSSSSTLIGTAGAEAAEACSFSWTGASRVSCDTIRRPIHRFCLCSTSLSFFLSSGSSRILSSMRFRYYLIWCAVWFVSPLRRDSHFGHPCVVEPVKEFLRHPEASGDGVGF